MRKLPQVGGIARKEPTVSADDETATRRPWPHLRRHLVAHPRKLRRGLFLATPEGCQAAAPQKELPSAQVGSELTDCSSRNLAHSGCLPCITVLHRTAPVTQMPFATQGDPAQPTPADPNPAPAHPPTPPEAPPQPEPIGVPSPAPANVPPPNEPLGVPPTSPPEIPANPTMPQPQA